MFSFFILVLFDDTFSSSCYAVSDEGRVSWNNWKGFEILSQWFHGGTEEYPRVSEYEAGWTATHAGPRLRRLNISRKWRVFSSWSWDTLLSWRRLLKLNLLCSKPSLIGLQLIGIEVWKIKNSVHSWVHTLKDMGFRSKRTFRLCWGLERLKPRKRISKIGLSWMKETLDWSFLSFYSF
jgi:hypothetical protein